MNPGDITPVLLGMTLPSAGAWMMIYIALIAIVIIAELVLWAYWISVGDAQYAEPATRERMNLATRVTPFGSRMRPAVERLAEPQRSRARRLYLAFNIALAAVVIAAVVTFALYFQFVF